MRARSRLGARANDSAGGWAVAGDVKPELIALIQRAIETKSRSMRQVFRMWDKDHDGFVTMNEMRKGMAEMNLGLPHSVIAKVANVMDVDGDPPLSAQHDAQPRSPNPQTRP